MSSPTGRSADEKIAGSPPLLPDATALAATRPHAGTPPDPTALAATRPHAGTPPDATALADTRPHVGQPAPPSRGSDGLIGQKVRAYRIVAELGRGGMGVVYEAVHDEIGQRAAVKTLNLQRLASSASDPAIALRFLTEAKALAIARHPGLVHIFDYGQLPDGTLFLLMEYLEGESLASRMQRRAQEAKEPPTAGRPPGMRSSQAVRLARQISDALTVTHEKGIYHRDLKPSNIYVVPDSEAPGGERVKILDFGLARIRPSKDGSAAEAGAGSAVARTSTSVVMGTPLYMAPEQCRGLAQADGPSDVYALGVMLYELLAGAPPFTGNTASDLIAMHIYQPPPPLARRVAGLPRALSNLVMSMLRKDPAERPTMAQVAQTLREIEREPKVLTAPRTSSPGKRLVLVLGAGALLALLWLLSAPLRNPSRDTKRPLLDDRTRVVAPLDSPPPPASPSGPVSALPASPTTSPHAAPAVTPAAPPIPPQATPSHATPPQPEMPAVPDRRPVRPGPERTGRRPADKPNKPSAGPEKTPGKAAAPPPTPAPSVTPAVPPEKPKEEEVHVPALR